MALSVAEGFATLSRSSWIKRGEVRSLLIALLLLGAGLAVTGCRGRRGSTVVHSQSAEARQLGRLDRLVARDLRCPDGAQRVELAPGLYEAAGCGLVRHYAYECSRRCRWRRVQPLEQIAARELSCQPQTVTIGMGAYSVDRVVGACGVQLTYRLACAEAGCAWYRVADAAQQPAQPPPAYGASAQQQGGAVMQPVQPQPAP